MVSAPTAAASSSPGARTRGELEALRAPGPGHQRPGEQCQEGGGGEVAERGELGQRGRRAGHAQEYGALPGGLFGPQNEREEGRAQARREAHIRGGQAGVRQHRGHEREQQGRQHRRRGAKAVAGPVEDHQGRQEEEGQDPGPHQGQKAIGVPGVDHESHTFAFAVGIARGTRPVQIGQQGGHGARQGRVLRFVAVHVLRQVFQAGRKVLRLIESQTELRVG
jgi:hypothetical protein